MITNLLEKKCRTFAINKFVEISHVKIAEHHCITLDKCQSASLVMLSVTCAVFFFINIFDDLSKK